MIPPDDGPYILQYFEPLIGWVTLSVAHTLDDAIAWQQSHEYGRGWMARVVRRRAART